MDWSDTEQEAAFRAEVRTLISEQLPQRYRRLAALPHQPERVWEFDRASGDPDRQAAAREWVAALSARHWIAPHWPQEYGGAGLSPIEQFIFTQEMTQAAAPSCGLSALQMLGPTLILHGSEEQKRAHLPQILAGEETWAQGYSEPGAGSDLAALQTRAVRDGDSFTLNGQKIWTSAAHTADWLFALVRTDPEAPKHRGISFVILPMDSPGISIRPLVDMSGEHYFNETFFEDVRVPADGLVGEEHRGWYVAMTLLDFERSNIAGAVSARRSINSLLTYVGGPDGRARSRIAEPTLRSHLADRWIETEVQFQFSMRVISMQNAGLVPNHEASTTKLFSSELLQRLEQTGTQCFGLYGGLWDEDEPHAPLGGSFTRAYVRSAAATVRGGTSEVQRNIIATRGLGLPRG